MISSVGGAPAGGGLGLCTDLYELTMAASYLRHGMNGEATFSLFGRQLPERRRFLIVAGVAEVLDALDRIRFDRDDRDYLRSLGLFDEAFLEWLAEYRFAGSVMAMPEGTVGFQHEPLLEITGPIANVQIVETLVLNIMHLHTTLTTTAAHTVLAARGRSIVDFGFRRAHGLHAGLAAARSAYVAGAAGTSNVAAGRAYGIPVMGTMAHSYVQACSDEPSAFDTFAGDYPDSTVLVIDTFDTVEGAHHAVSTASAMADRGAQLRGVRLDSGDLHTLSRTVRATLDAAGLEDVEIVASGGLDADRIAALVEAGAPIDAFGVGTRMTTAADAPYLDLAYKLVSYNGRPTMKLSPSKVTWPEAKQVYRFVDSSGRFLRDVIGLREQRFPTEGARPLLGPVMQCGERCGTLPSLEHVRHHCARQLAALPSGVRSREERGDYAVEFSDALVASERRVRARLASIGAAHRNEVSPI